MRWHGAPLVLSDPCQFQATFLGQIWPTFVQPPAISAEPGPIAVNKDPDGSNFGRNRRKFA